MAFAAITALLKAQDHAYIIFIMYNYWIFGYIFVFFWMYVMIIQDYARILSFFMSIYLPTCSYIYFLIYFIHPCSLSIYLSIYLYIYTHTHNRFNFYVHHLGNRLGCWHVPYATLIWNKTISFIWIKKSWHKRNCIPWHKNKGTLTY